MADELARSGSSSEFLGPEPSHPKKIVLEPHRKMDAKWLFLETLKYIYLYHSSKTIQIIGLEWYK
jgi:hypothetical protein